MKEKLNRKGSCSPKVGGRVGYYNTELKDWLMFIASTENIADAAELLIWLKGGRDDYRHRPKYRTGNQWCNYWFGYSYSYLLLV